MTSLLLFPAVDVRKGQAVQLVQGVAGTEKVFGDPLEQARRWRDAGAQWIHLVDLDAAFGDGQNTEITSRIAGELGINVELTGGIRDDASLRRALDAGAARVNIGTAALENPEWCEHVIADYGDKVAIALDVRDGKLAARGWTTEGGDALATVERLSIAGCERFVVTDVASDGMLSGPNLELLGAVSATMRANHPEQHAKVIASGGVSRLEDLVQLRGLVPIGVEGAIIGTALYVGNFTLAEAIDVAGPQELN
ncbi:bifunctional 1-(5-phosphoribosyl)-5-((5-phosphoribosylamino) methylidenea mino)imidazole-4-carboxamide isomerase/phosphoribosylanthranilate isomerase PriA [Luteococcus sanguinis]